MTYRSKYITPLTKPIGHGGPGVPANPDNWTPEAIVERDIYYGYLKHKAQAKYRGEEHTLTPEQWRELWTLDRWFCRGKGAHDLCLVQKDREKGWHHDNVEVVERAVYLRRNLEYRRLRRE